MKQRVAVVGLVLGMVFATAGGCSAPRAAVGVGVGVGVEGLPEKFPVEDYNRTRMATNQRLGELQRDLRPRLSAGTPQERQRAAKDIAVFLRTHLSTHADEVDLLYRFADRDAGPRYTETMRYQHREIESRIAFLESLAAAEEPDVEMFRSKLTSLVHYLNAHLDTELYTIAVLVVDNEMERRRVSAR
ncbi:hypothetical protein PHYC_01038 [Phycisphaerales bacterium]|nr:hypothetical protein PHYC_01038 [Phycisphaerales bacterium]